VVFWLGGGANLLLAHLPPLSQTPGQAGKEDESDQVKDELAHLVERRKRHNHQDSSSHVRQNRTKNQRQPVATLLVRSRGQISDDQQRQTCPGQANPNGDNRRDAGEGRGGGVGQPNQDPSEQTEDEGDWP
jgi:hypothetical protein